MRIVAMTRALNEADIIECFVRHTSAFVAHHVIMDDGSSDGTIDILTALKREGCLSASIRVNRSHRMSPIL
jgi:glycosyltransferase involved in cell wall biosynthesis